MIDIATEQVVSLSDAAKILPRRRAGAKPHIATLYRWTQRGVKGVLLETIQIGGTRCTSVEAMQRFFDTLTAGSNQSRPLPPSRTLSAAELARVDRELDEAWGIGPQKRRSSSASQVPRRI